MFTYVMSLTISGVGLTLNGMSLTNNSIVTNTDIGTGAAALVCTTTYTPCCSSFNNPETQWYFPNGTQVQNILSLPYRRTRGRFPGRVTLNRNSESTITGIFHCDIPDVSGVTQSLYVGIYTSTTGESCILCVFAWLFHLFARKYLALQSKTVYTFQVLVYVYPSTAYHLVNIPH